jgi:hypothetical protein
VVSDLKTFAHKECKLPHNESFFSGVFCSTISICLVSVLLSKSVERSFVSHTGDFFSIGSAQKRISELNLDYPISFPFVQRVKLSLQRVIIVGVISK